MSSSDLHNTCFLVELIVFKLWLINSLESTLGDIIALCQSNQWKLGISVKRLWIQWEFRENWFIKNVSNFHSSHPFCRVL